MVIKDQTWKTEMPDHTNYCCKYSEVTSAEGIKSRYSSATFIIFCDNYRLLGFIRRTFYTILVYTTELGQSVVRVQCKCSFSVSQELKF